MDNSSVRFFVIEGQKGCRHFVSTRLSSISGGCYLDIHHFSDVCSDGVSVESYMEQERWGIEVMGDRCRFAKDVMIRPALRSLGLGSLYLKLLIEAAQQSFPDCSMKGTLSLVDATEDNIGRRERLYRRFGFLIHYDGNARKSGEFKTDALKYLTPGGLPANITEIENIGKYLHELHKESFSWKSRADKAEAQNTILTECDLSNIVAQKSLQKDLFTARVALFAAVCVLVLMLTYG